LPVARMAGATGESPAKVARTEEKPNGPNGSNGTPSVNDAEKKLSKDKLPDKEKKEKHDKEPKDGGEKKDKKEKKDKDRDKKDKKDKKGKEGKSDGGKGEKRDRDGEKKGDKHKKNKDRDKDKKKNHKSSKSSKRGKLGKAKVKVKNSLVKKAAAAAKKKKKEPPKKAIVKTEDDYEPVNRWWEREDGALSGKRGAKKWDTFEHHGLLYAPDYQPHGIPIRYEGKKVELSTESEELATYYCTIRNTPYESNEIFLRNFWKVFSASFPQDTIVKELSKCNFDEIAEWREAERQKRLNRTKEEKEELKKKNDTETAYFAYALINGVREKLGAFKLEPPQLFRGRGEHPKQGLLKKRTFPESVTINIAEDSAVPRIVGMPGHAYKDVVHENSVQWIANFEDSLLGETKYVSFGATSSLKGQPDVLKYDRARRLLRCIGNIRQSYEKLLKSKSLMDRQKATATYFIDKLALRVGGEKNTEEEADTVGCCSLRCEHMKLEPPCTIHFDFLGKDSIRYQNTVQVSEQVYQNIDSFYRGKSPEEDVFDKVVPSTLNDYFKDFMEDLTAKVFRTFNASYTLQSELDKFERSKKNSLTQDELLKFYNNANREVAILCNHQKAVSKQHADSMIRMQEVKDTMEKNVRILKKHLVALANGKPPKNPDSKLPKDVSGCKKKIAETKMRLDKHNTAMAMKEDNKTVSLGTSKVNYMDPRITVAWCKKVDLAIEKVFPRTVRTKFPWAMHFKSTYQFD